MMSDWKARLVAALIGGLLLCCGSPPARAGASVFSLNHPPRPFSTTVRRAPPLPPALESIDEDIRAVEGFPSDRTDGWDVDRFWHPEPGQTISVPLSDTQRYLLVLEAPKQGPPPRLIS